jgi:hypothetical protein
MRKYDYQLFDNLVKDYYWPDHQAPPLTTLFIICDDMYEFMKSKLSLIKKIRKELLPCIAIMAKVALAQQS